MYARKLNSLAQMKRADRITVLSDGLPLIAANALAYERDARHMNGAGRFRSAAVLHSYAEEEAAKVVILLDLVRGGLDDAALVKKAVRNFYSHLARGIYARVYETNIGSLDEARRYTTDLRQKLYLDGPMDVDWIFGNEVTTDREERLYVDYVEYENQERRWVSPLREGRDEFYELHSHRSWLLELVDVLGSLGVLSPGGVEATSAAWSGAAIDDDTYWDDFWRRNESVLQELRRRGQEFTDADQPAINFICQRWAIPLLPLDLSEIKTNIDDLTREREWRLDQLNREWYGDIADFDY